LKRKLNQNFYLPSAKQECCVNNQLKLQNILKFQKQFTPDGTEIKHNRITSVPENKNDFEAQVHVFTEIKNSVSK
jgi:hypothetical protein